MKKLAKISTIQPKPLRVAKPSKVALEIQLYGKFCRTNLQITLGRA